MCAFFCGGTSFTWGGGGGGGQYAPVNNVRGDIIHRGPGTFFTPTGPKLTLARTVKFAQCIELADSNHSRVRTPDSKSYSSVTPRKRGAGLHCPNSLAFAVANTQCTMHSWKRKCYRLFLDSKKFHRYSLKFKLITDHKPLLTILSPKKGIPSLWQLPFYNGAWAVLLSAYQHNIHSKSTHEHANADELSHLLDSPAITTHPTTILVVHKLKL